MPSSLNQQHCIGMSDHCLLFGRLKPGRQEIPTTHIAHPLPALAHLGLTSSTETGSTVHGRKASLSLKDRAQMTLASRLHSSSGLDLASVGVRRTWLIVIEQGLLSPDFVHTAQGLYLKEGP